MLALALTMSSSPTRGTRSVFRVDFVGLGLLPSASARCGPCSSAVSARLVRVGSVRLLAITSAISLITFIWHELNTDHPVVGLRILEEQAARGMVSVRRLLGVCLYATVFAIVGTVRIGQRAGRWHRRCRSGENDGGVETHAEHQAEHDTNASACLQNAQIHDR